MNRLHLFWLNLRSSLWFLPSVIVMANILLAVALVEADAFGAKHWSAPWPRFLGAGAEGARGMLSTIAGSMMSVVGVTFSMVLIVLSLASSQYTSRVLRNFMRSRITQTVLGVFTGIYAYCLIVLRTIRNEGGETFVPELAVFIGFALALAGVAILIYFLHHVATSIQASSVIDTVTRETLAAIERLYPNPIDAENADTAEEPAISLNQGQRWWPIPAAESGYIQSVDIEALKEIAEAADAVVRMELGVGEFTVKGTPIAAMALQEAPEPAVTEKVQAAFIASNFRTVEQDVSFGIRQLVDVALKALSPGINDTTTAVTCANYLATILARLAPREFPSLCHFKDDTLRVLGKAPTFEDLLGEAFNEIRRNAAGNVTVLVCMLGALRTLMGLAGNLERRRAISDQARWISEITDRTVDAPQDRAEIETAMASVFNHVAETASN